MNKFTRIHFSLTFLIKTQINFFLIPVQYIANQNSHLIDAMICSTQYQLTFLLQTFLILFVTLNMQQHTSFTLYISNRDNRIVNI